MAWRCTALLGCSMVLAAAGLAGCNLRSHDVPAEQARRQAAEDTREIRKDAQQAGAEARKAAEVARRNAEEVIAGVRQGWKEGGPKGASGEGARLDLNTASTEDLSALPGLSPGDGRRIARHRPYKAPGELVSRGVLTQDQYDRIADRVEVHSKAG